MNSESTLSDALSEVDTALAASDNERAAGLASELLLAYPNAVSVLRQRARALAASGRALQAAEVHRRVLEILPADGEAMAGLARTLHSAGQHAEAREAARQALDYSPKDDLLRRIAASEGQPFHPDEASMQLRKSLAQTQVGMLGQGIAGLRTVVSRWPDRVDAKVALMQALWRNGARIGAAEQAQAVLDDYPNCMNAHLLMLDMWRAAGASDMERVHQQAIEQIDPDYRVARAMLGVQSPLQARDVPARPAPPSEPAASDEDPLAREDWVANLVAASLALPKPLEQLRESSPESSPGTADELAADAATDSDEDDDFASTLLPLEWSSASDLSDESVPDDFTVSWIDGDVKDEFLPARPRTAVPDPRDGVPEALDPLEWEEAQDESTASAPASRNFSTSVDGGPAQHDAEQTENAAEEAQPESDYRPLKPLTAAGAITAAIRKAIARNDGDDAGKQADPAQTQASGDPALSAAAPAAPAESAPQQTRADSKATAAIKAEVESASVKPMPINAVEYVDEDMDRWAGDEGGAAPETAEADQPASVNEPLQPAQTAAPAKSTPAQTVAAAQEAPAAPAANAENNDVLPKVLAAAATLGVVKKKHKKREAENAKAEENASIAPAAEDETATVAQSAAPSVPAEPEQDDMNPAEDAAPAAKPAKPKRAKKPAKPAARETQTEKVRKTYERAIATARREDIPKLIAELNQATEVDPDNKIIYELLGQAYNRSGDIPAAINAYRRALSLAERS